MSNTKTRENGSDNKPNSKSYLKNIFVYFIYLKLLNLNKLTRKLNDTNGTLNEYGETTT